MADTENRDKNELGSFYNVDVLKSGPPVETTIDSLIKLPRPKTHQNRSVEETKIYTITGKIFYWTIEPDKDIHIAIRSRKAKMICEIPAPSHATNSMVLNEIIKARKEFFKHRRSWFRMQPGLYRITGVLFYDKSHIEIGSNKNHVELHPVLEFKKL